jgi:flagellar basal body-associated protein FliL
VEEEGELSQDDIDSLMGGNDPVDAGVEEEGELSQDDIDSLMGGNDPVDADVEEEGELSQDDIDSLMGGNDPVDAGVEEEGELSQDDIDSLMGGNDPVDPSVEEEGELSQDDIDSLMGGNADEDADMELVSQNDIEQLMNPSVENDSIPPDDPGNDIAEGDTDELISMDDIQGLLGEDPVGEDTGDTVIDDYVIDNADALDVSQCLITQETFDALIQNSLTSEEVPDPVAPDSDPVVLDEPEPLLPEQGAGEQSEDDLDLEASGELEDLLNTDLDDTQLDLGGTVGDDVSQEDIDALLQESDEDEDLLDDDEDILISQDDIDTLLMAADQEDEDLLGDLMGDDMDASMDDDFDDEDILERDEESSEEMDGDQVVLEGGDDEPEDEDHPAKSDHRWKNWYKSRLVVATASIIIVLGISVPSVYFLFFSQAPVQIPEKNPVPVAMEVSGRDVEVASVEINTSQTLDLRKSGNIILTNFVVLASDLSKEMAYVTADISIDYSDQRAYHEINDNLSFYRDLIYESIQKNLLSEKRNEVTEADLIWGIETTLKKILPPDFIEKVSFKSFKAS